MTTVGGSALFLCSSITDWLDDVVWQANDSNLTENENVTIRMVFGRGRLELHNIPLADNLTVISCHGSVRGNEVVGTSRVLLLQGKKVMNTMKVFMMKITLQAALLLLVIWSWNMMMISYHSNGHRPSPSIFRTGQQVLPTAVLSLVSHIWGKRFNFLLSVVSEIIPLSTM